MASVFTDLLRIRSLREERSERALKESQSVVEIAEQAVSQAAALLEQFTRTLSAKIEAEYARIEEEARRAKGVPLHRIQSFRSFETHMHAQREELNLALAEKQKALKEAHEALDAAHQALMQAMRARMKIEQLRTQERERQRKEQERSEEKLLEEFKPQSVFAQLQ